MEQTNTPNVTTKNKTNWKYLFVVIFVALFSGVAILYYVYLKDILQPVPSPTPISTPKQKEISLSLVKEYDTNLRLAGLYSKLVSFKNHIYFIYLGEFGLELAVFDLSDVFNPQKINSGNELSIPNKEIAAMYFKDNYLYLSGSEAVDEIWMGAYDLLDPSKPTFAWFVKDELIEQIAVSDKYAFLLGSKFMTYDISDPEKPILLSSLETSNIGTDAMCISGNYVYLGGMFKGISVMDVSNKEKPVLVGKDEGATEDLFCVGNIIYQMSSSSLKSSKDRFIVLDATDPIDIKLLKYFGKEELQDFYQIGNNLFITYEGGILIFDISNPADPILMKDITGDFGLISGQEKYFYSLISDPSNPRNSILKIYEIKYE